MRLKWLGLCITTTLLLSAGLGHAQSSASNVTDAPLSIYQQMQRPLAIFTVNAVSGFTEELQTLNAQKLVLRSLNENEPAMLADSFVFFLRSEADLNTLPQLFRQVYQAGGGVEETDLSQYIEFTLENGRPMAASFVFLDRYGDADHLQVACKSALDFYASVSGLFSDAERMKRYRECVK